MKKKDFEIYLLYLLLKNMFWIRVVTTYLFIYHVSEMVRITSNNFFQFLELFTYLCFMDFNQRKQLRKEHFEKNVKGWKLKPCLACNGSGYYDNFIGGRIPKCSSCKGPQEKKNINPK
jgi:hypothetical protein